MKFLKCMFLIPTYFILYRMRIDKKHHIVDVIMKFILYENHNLDNVAIKSGNS